MRKRCVAAALAGALLLAGCGGSATSSPGVPALSQAARQGSASQGSQSQGSQSQGSSTRAAALHAAAQCIRQHGIPSYTDPVLTASGQVYTDSRSMQDASQPVIDAVYHACSAVVAAPIVVAGVTAGIVLSGPPWRSPHPAAAAAVPLGTAPVVRTDLTNTVQVSGSIGYAGSYTVVNQAAGTAYTALPAPGATIRRGQALYEVDGTPVTLFYGPTPEWRAPSARRPPPPAPA